MTNLNKLILELQNRVESWRGVSTSDAEEIVAESLLVMATKLAKGIVIEKPDRWLLRTAKLVRLHSFSKQRGCSLPEVDFAFPERSNEEPPAVLFVRSCLANLPESSRRAIELRDFGNLTIVEAAAIERVPRKTMQSKLRRAYQQLRKLMVESVCPSADLRSAG